MNHDGDLGIPGTNFHPGFSLCTLVFSLLVHRCVPRALSFGGSSGVVSFKFVTSLLGLNWRFALCSLTIVFSAHSRLVRVWCY